MGTAAAALRAQGCSPGDVSIAIGHIATEPSLPRAHRGRSPPPGPAGLRAAAGAWRPPGGRGRARAPATPRPLAARPRPLWVNHAHSGCGHAPRRASPIKARRAPEVTRRAEAGGAWGGCRRAALLRLAAGEASGPAWPRWAPSAGTRRPSARRSSARRLLPGSPPSGRRRRTMDTPRRRGTRPPTGSPRGGRMLVRGR